MEKLPKTHFITHSFMHHEVEETPLEA